MFLFRFLGRLGRRECFESIGMSFSKILTVRRNTHGKTEEESSGYSFGSIDLVRLGGSTDFLSIFTYYSLLKMFYSCSRNGRHSNPLTIPNLNG